MAKKGLKANPSWPMPFKETHREVQSNYGLTLKPWITKEGNGGEVYHSLTQTTCMQTICDKLFPWHCGLRLIHLNSLNQNIQGWLIMNDLKITSFARRQKYIINRRINGSNYIRIFRNIFLNFWILFIVLHYKHTHWAWSPKYCEGQAIWKECQIIGNWKHDQVGAPNGGPRGRLRKR